MQQTLLSGLLSMVLTILLPLQTTAQIQLLGVGTIPGDATDLSGLKGNQTDGTPHNRLGGMGSAIGYTGQGNHYVLASDRGPKDGATDFACRYHRMEIVVTPGAANPVALKLTATHLLKNEQGQQFVGTLSAIDARYPEKSLRLDPEGIRVGPQGTLFLADEYGPFVREFSVEGKCLRRLPVPDRFLSAVAGGKPDEELPPKNTRGRQPNRGMEGLAISPDGKKLFGLMQSPLIQDGGLSPDNKRVGINNRLLEINLADGKTREFIYQLDDQANGVSEILAVNDHTFLVLERDSRGGLDAQCKKLFLIDLEGADDVSKVDSLPAGKLPAGLNAVTKRLFLDMLDPVYQLKGADFPEKIEGLAFGPPFADGRQLLIVTADNDFVATAPFRVYAFAIDPTALPGYQPQRFDHPANSPLSPGGRGAGGEGERR
ncbi:MAG: esterase-like activity of phytase family protein [Gemmatales bacterium]